MHRDSGQFPDFIEVGDGKPVIMVPGMEGSKHFWKYQLEALGQRYRAVASDLPVIGPSLSSTMSDYADRVLKLVDHLGIDRAVFIGESFGGFLVQELVINHAEKVAAVVLCNTMERPRGEVFGFNMFTLATLVHQFAFLPFLTDSQRRRLLSWVGRHRGFVMDPSPGNDELIEYLFDHGLECGGRAYLDRMIAAGKGDYTYRLEGINVPALIIRGTEDRLVASESIVQQVGRIPDASLALIEGGGHCCTFTRPDPSNRVILEFLEGIGY